MHGDAVVRDVDAVHACTVPDLDTERLRTRSEHAFERFHLDREARTGGAWQAMRPLRCIDAVVVEHDAREMAGRAARLSDPVRGRGDAFVRHAVFREVERRDLVEQAATVQRLEGGRGEAAQAERQALERRTRIVGLLEHEHGHAGEAQFAGQEQAYRAGTGDDDVEHRGSSSNEYRTRMGDARSPTMLH